MGGLFLLTQSANTKEAIFLAAADLFARENYYNVSVRQIAEKVGIMPSSIYNHYKSKESILLDIYAYFDDNMQRLKPDLDELLLLAEMAHPHEVLHKTTFTFPQEIMRTMLTTMLVTSSMCRVDERADRVTFRNLVEMSFEFDVPLLEKMVALGRVEPIDIKGFALLHSSFSYSSAIRFYSGNMMSTEEWFQGLELLFQLVKVVPGIEIS